MALTLGPKDFLRLGDWNALCDICGQKFKASELRLRWDGFRTCQQDWEERHPQELIKIPQERPAPPWVRPVPEDTFVTVAPVDPNSL